MSSYSSPADLFARVVLALEPYSKDVVFIGGWVHALYLAEANDTGRPVFTDDIDISIPRKLLLLNRPSLVELATTVGFDKDEISDVDDAALRLVLDSEGTLVDLDILTEGSDPRVAVPIEGQPDLKAQGYPGIRILLDNHREIIVNSKLSPILDPPRNILVPRLGAYVIHKLASSSTRTNRFKAAKDLVYAYEIVRHPSLGQAAIEEIPGLIGPYHDIADSAVSQLDLVIESEVMLESVADQLITGGRALGTTMDLVPRIRGQFRRVRGRLTGNT